MIEFKDELKKSALHFFVAMAKDEVKLRSRVTPTAWYKQGYELIPLSPEIGPLDPLPDGPNIDILKAMCFCMKCVRGPADEIVVILTEEPVTLVSWIHPDKVKTMQFETSHEFGFHKPREAENTEDERFEDFREFLN